MRAMILWTAATSGATAPNLALSMATDGWNGASGKLALGGTDTLYNIRNVEGSDFNDQLIGNAADNSFIGRSGNDAIDGGGGNDTVIYSGSRSEYVISKQGNNYIVQDKVNGRDGTDTLSNIETIAFSDGAYAIADLVSTAPTQSGVAQDGYPGVLRRAGSSAKRGLFSTGHDRLAGAGQNRPVAGAHFPQGPNARAHLAGKPRRQSFAGAGPGGL